MDVNFVVVLSVVEVVGLVVVAVNSVGFLKVDFLVDFMVIGVGVDLVAVLSVVAVVGIVVVVGLVIAVGRMVVVGLVIVVLLVGILLVVFCLEAFDIKRSFNQFKHSD